MKEKVKSNLVIEIENKIVSILKKEGFELIDVEITGGKDRYITVYIYKNEKNDLEELGNLNRVIYPAIETIPQLKNGFVLEVSSPGIFRKFKYAIEINIFKDKTVKIISNEGEEIIGVLFCLNTGNEVEIILNGKIINISIDNIKSIQLNG